MVDVIEEFNKLYYERKGSTWSKAMWMSTIIHKNPCDLWIYQEIIAENKPDYIIETGTFMGGSALYLANICDLLGHGNIITIDIKHRDGRPVHDRIKYITASSTDQEVFDTVKEETKDKKTMVILDSDHRKAHVMKELELYSEIVTIGNYLIVEDTNINGHPSAVGWGQGPWEAVAEWLPKNENYICDENMEKLMLTFNPRGFLKRVK